MNKQTENALKMAIEVLSQDEGWFEPEAAIQACKEALEQPAQEYLTRAQQVIRANNSAQGLDPYVLAGLTLEMCAWLPDDNMDIPRAEWRDKVITQALKCMQECNITQETDDIDEEVIAWLQS